MRRRLFEPLAGPDAFKQRDVTARAFADLYHAQSAEFPPECKGGDYRDGSWLRSRAAPAGRQLSLGGHIQQHARSQRKVDLIDLHGRVLLYFDAWLR